jgi:hypothetical protein
LYFTARTGAEGLAWATEYRSHRAILELTNHALDRMRGGQLDKGWGQLKDYRNAIDSLVGIPNSMRAEMYRRYHAAAGYYYYCIENYELAHRAMCLAHEKTVEAIHECRFLVMLAIRCQEYCVHRARIARKHRRWAEMHELIGLGWAMNTNQAPLCQLPDGYSIFFSTLIPFFHSLEPLTEEELLAIHRWTDDSERDQIFDRFVRLLIRRAGAALDWR